MNLFVLSLWLQLTQSLFVCSIARELKTEENWREAMWVEERNMRILSYVYGGQSVRVAVTLHRCECMNAVLLYHIVICMGTYSEWA